MDTTASDDAPDVSQDVVQLSTTASDSELDSADYGDNEYDDDDSEHGKRSGLAGDEQSDEESLLDPQSSTSSDQHQHSVPHSDEFNEQESDLDASAVQVSGTSDSDGRDQSSTDAVEHPGPRVVAEVKSLSMVREYPCVNLEASSDDVHDSVEFDTTCSSAGDGQVSGGSILLDESSILNSTTASSSGAGHLDHDEQYQHLMTTTTTATASESDLNQSEARLMVDLSGAGTDAGSLVDSSDCYVCETVTDSDEERGLEDSAADKPDYGLKEIPSLKNIKSRFESTDYDESDQGQLSTPVKRSESIITKMAKFQGLHSPEIGNGDDSSSSDEDMERDPEIIRESKHKKEKTTYTQSAKTQEESKGNLKAKYESACEESSIVRSPSHIGGDELHVNGEARTSSIKERFEKGDVVNDLENDKVERIQREKEEDLSVFKEQQVSSNDARNLFKQIDATTSKSGTVLNSASYNNVGVLRSPSMRSKEVLVQHTTVTDGEIVRAGDKIDEDVQAPVDLTSRFKFFQNFNDSPNQQERKRFTITPPRDDVAPKESSPEPLAARDPAVVRADDNADDLVVTDTARKMLSKFRELESQAEKGDDSPVGPKPLKRITPPREFTREGEGSPEPELPRNPDIVRACDKVEDDFLIEAHKAKSLRAKFEHWDDENEVERENRRNAADEINPNADSAKSLKAKFEALKESDRSLLDNKPKPKVNRFI